MIISIIVNKCELGQYPCVVKTNFTYRSTPHLNGMLQCIHTYSRHSSLLHVSLVYPYRQHTTLQLGVLRHNCCHWKYSVIEHWYRCVATCIYTHCSILPLIKITSDHCVQSFLFEPSLATVIPFLNYAMHSVNKLTAVTSLLWLGPSDDEYHMKSVWSGRSDSPCWELI